MIVDHQTHWWPPAVVELLQARERVPRIRRSETGWTYHAVEGAAIPVSPRHSDLDALLAQAAEGGVERVVLSPGGLGEVMHVAVDEAVAIVDQVNVALAEAQRRHPDRIAAIAALPMQDADAALDTLERAAALGLRGVSVLTSNDNRSIAAPELLRVYQRLDELGLPLFLHPGVGGNLVPAESFRITAGLGWMYQTAAAALALVDSGTLDECPGLAVVHPHLGGVLPYVFQRVAALPGDRASRPLDRYLRTHFYVDTVSSTAGALSMAIATYGLDRVVFASDYPYYEAAQARRWVSDNATPDEAEAIFGNCVPGLFAQ